MGSSSLFDDPYCVQDAAAGSYQDHWEGRQGRPERDNAGALHAAPGVDGISDAVRPLGG